MPRQGRVVVNTGGVMAAWVQAGNRKMNLDRATWIDRTENGEVQVHVVFDGALNHTFRGPAADKVWKMIVARKTDAPPAKTAAGPSDVQRPRRRARSA
jgi:hypothetical protein